MSEKAPQQYLGPAGRGRPEPPSAWDMVKEQVMAPQYRESNLTYVNPFWPWRLGAWQDWIGRTMGLRGRGCKRGRRGREKVEYDGGRQPCQDQWHG